MQVPAPFEYARASSIDEAISMLERLGPESRLRAQPVQQRDGVVHTGRSRVVERRRYLHDLPLLRGMVRWTLRLSGVDWSAR